MAKRPASTSKASSGASIAAIRTLGRVLCGPVWEDSAALARATGIVLVAGSRKRVAAAWRGTMRHQSRSTTSSRALLGRSIGRAQDLTRALRRRLLDACPAAKPTSSPAAATHMSSSSSSSSAMIRRLRRPGATIVRGPISSSSSSSSPSSSTTSISTYSS